MSETRVEIPDLRSLVGHREFVRAGDSLESVHQKFSAGRHDFLAVLEGRSLLGLCARRDMGTLLGARYGFALYARAAIRDHLTKDAIRIGADDRLTDVLQAISARRDEHFYDDILLVDAAGDFLGLVYVRDLVRLQTTLLMGNIAELEARQAEIAAKNRQMEDDLRMAREVQVAMLPREFPSCGGPGGNGLRFAQLYEPAGGVGGDFFEILPVSETSAGIIVCDVMGHGVRSALITAMVRTMIEELRPQAADPANFLTQLNAHLTKLLRRTGDTIFVTAVYLLVDVAQQRLVCAQAGHPTPLLWTKASGRAQPLHGLAEVGGPALGLMDDFAFEAVALALAPGDRVLCFTDGVFEAAGESGEEFGLNRLATVLQETGGRDLAAALPAIKQAAADFSGGQGFADDVCLVACELEAGRTAFTVLSGGGL